MLEREAPATNPRQFGIAISVARPLAAEQTEALVCKVWQTDLKIRDPQWVLINIYYDLTRDQYVPGLGTFDPPSPVERNRSAHRFAGYMFGYKVKRLTLFKKPNGTAIVPTKYVEFDASKDCSPARSPKTSQ